MKKMIAVLLMLCVCIGLCACGGTKGFADKLQRDGLSVVKMEMDDKRVLKYEEKLGISAANYEIESLLDARYEEVNGAAKKLVTAVVIVECGSDSKAESLVNDTKGVIDLLKTEAPEKTYVCEQKGNVVLYGEEEYVNKALGK